jgi:hypothetical protein
MRARRIKLTQGYFAVVDGVWYEKLSIYKWQAVVCGKNIYAVRSVYLNGTQTQIRMHRQIISAKEGEIVDHADRDGLNNRTNNLRIATNGQNRANALYTKNLKHGYRGIFKSGKKWASHIKANGKRYYLGSFETKPEAHAAFVACHRVLHGEFSCYLR